jgi:NAD(P)-dependent dehydrogenase (short-subunit alcohol dehydrogenase family)
VRAVYVVFGATGGIGSALSRRLACQPHAPRVVLVGRNQEKLNALQSAIQQELLGAGGLDRAGPLSTLVADVTDSKAVEAAMATAMEASGGRLAGVANCVGSIVLKAAHQTSDTEFEQVCVCGLHSSRGPQSRNVKTFTILTASSANRPVSFLLILSFSASWLVFQAQVGLHKQALN